LDNVIEVEGLKKHFRTAMRRKRVEAVRSVSFQVARGEIFGFLGPNGAGKTTTIKTIVGLIRPTAGRVRLLGGEPGALPVMARVGFLPEQPYFYDYLKPQELLDTFGRVFGLSAADRRRRIDRLLTQVGLDEARTKTLRKFSKGMLQRVGIAQALINDPDLVILDEPLSGLDPIGRREVIDLIASLKTQGKTVFFSSHILADIERLCDRVVIIDRGVVRAQGTLTELLDTGGSEKEILVEGELAGSELASISGVHRVDHVGAAVHRVVVAGEAADAALRQLLDRGVGVLSVTERRMSLEALFLDQAFDGPQGGESQ
jgi:ABC-2 type transport system ATP-binding protein